MLVWAVGQQVSIETMPCQRPLLARKIDERPLAERDGRESDELVIVGRQATGEGLEPRSSPEGAMNCSSAAREIKPRAPTLVQVQPRLSA